MRVSVSRQPATTDNESFCRRVRDCLAETAGGVVHNGVPATRGLRHAAVLVPVIARDDGHHLLLTRRSESLNQHAGQISFPGGCLDPTDPSLLQAALREAHEETGLAPEQVSVLGALSPHATPSGFLIHPFVGFVAECGALVRQPEEVAEIFEVPLGFLLDQRNHRPHDVEHQGRRYRLTAMPYGSYFIWGATAAIIRDFHGRLQEASPELVAGGYQGQGAGTVDV
ncbi:MAG: CoA pyrophosphatase [Ectothiorhodospiraceae bacterium]